MYTPVRPSRVERITIRHTVEYQLRWWKRAEHAGSERPVLVLAHGWMDVGASFQFVVDHLARDRDIVALDWRGFGGSRQPTPVDSYWFGDYYGDLDAVIEHVSPSAPVDLLGHSMGGNVVMTYAGSRPARIRRLINLEGFGMAEPPPSSAPARLTTWLDELKAPKRMRGFATQADVIDNLRTKNPRLSAAHAAWLSDHWAEPGADGRWHVQGDPVHKGVNPVLYRRAEALAAWAAIQCPVLWAEGANTHSDRESRGASPFPRAEFEERLGAVRSVRRAIIDDCGHMLHYDQPAALAQLIEDFLDD
ncbi:alpha/beta fold hydrolase [Achromobacter sp. GG226]|uniref:alpha/beta fold hydrolase n=1 Tax=Verticiella alkaliphila TaxID=2779529 RepID=UPI001C0CEFC5|nr:alpha/beta hydrolase [Verticiella sp. GG226]MBU4612522.1 alpha/beta fold hydrolase [Verticiella sp. GG226]